MPYVDGDCITQPNTNQRNDAAQNKAYQWVALDKNDVAGIKQTLDQGFPIVNMFQVFSSFYTTWSNGGIFAVVGIQSFRCCVFLTNSMDLCVKE